MARLADQESLTTPIIDLSSVETLPTASLKSLVLLSGERERAPLILAAPSRRARQVIELGGFSDYFAVYPSVEDALTAGVGLMREYLFLATQHDVNDLTIFEMAGIFNVDDGSYALLPAVNYSISEELEARFRFFWLDGDDESEFGFLPLEVGAQLRLEYHF